MSIKIPVRIAGNKPASSLERLSKMDNGSSSEYLSVDYNFIAINKDNIRSTFLSVAELKKFIEKIGWPEDALNGGLEDPLLWIEEKGIKDKRLPAFIGVVEMALSIKSNGQIHPVSVKRTESHYSTIVGSTRVMACYLLKRKVDVKVTSVKNEIEELSIHLSENMDRKNLSFTEAFRGYEKLFNLMIDKGLIKKISRYEIMKQLNFSRAQSGRWNRILNRAKTDEAYRRLLNSGRFNSIRDAYDFIEDKPVVEPTPPPVSNEGVLETQVETPVDTPPPALNSDVLEEPAEKPTEKQGRTDFIKIVASELHTVERLLMNMLKGEIEFHKVNENHNTVEAINELIAKSFPLKSISDAQLVMDFVLNKNKSDQAC